MCNYSHDAFVRRPEAWGHVCSTQGLRHTPLHYAQNMPVVRRDVYYVSAPQQKTQLFFNTIPQKRAEIIKQL